MPFPNKYDQAVFSQFTDNVYIYIYGSSLILHIYDLAMKILVLGMLSMLIINKCRNILQYLYI